MIRRMTILIALSLAGVQICSGQAALSVTPAYAVITRDAPHGTFTLRNEGTEGVEVVISARYGVIATDNQSTDVMLGEGGMLGDLTEKLLFFPDRCVLAPGDERVVRFLVDDVAAADEKAFITLMHFEMRERGAPSLEQVPVVASALSIVYNLVTPLVFVNGISQPILNARAVRAAPGELVLELSALNAWPFLGGVSVVQEDAAIGRVETAVYTRRWVTIPLLPGPLPDAVTLTFDTRYTGMAAEVRRQLIAPPSVTLNLVP